MKVFAEKLRAVEESLARESGPFHLFALFLRDDSPDVWDLLVAAPWIESDKAKALHLIAEKVNEIASADELSKLSRIAIIEVSNPALFAIQSAMQVEHGLAEIANSNFFGLAIKHAFVITSRKPGIQVAA